jgi:hypothetical protein
MQSTDQAAQELKSEAVTKRIAIFGGSFDPPCCSHMQVCKLAVTMVSTLDGLRVLKFIRQKEQEGGLHPRRGLDRALWQSPGQTKRPAAGDAPPNDRVGGQGHLSEGRTRQNRQM